MGNLNRGPRKFLVNSLDQTKFGMYTNTAGTRILVDKENGLAIPYATTVDVVAGYGKSENLETIVLNLFAPYPSETVDWLVELNLTAVPRKSEGGYTNHRELPRLYSGKVDSLNIASGTEVALADKLLALKDIVKYCNHDELRFANAGMIYVVKNKNSTTASTITITLEDGSIYTVTTVGATDSLASVINANTNLNPYMTAYAPTASNNAAGDVTIIVAKTGTNPSWFLVEDDDSTTDLLAAYLMLVQLEEGVKLSYGGGLTTTKWEKIPYYMTVATTSAATADDGNVTVTVDGTGTALNVASGTATAKALETAQLISYFDTTIDKADTHYISVLNAAGVYTTVALGPQTFVLSNTAGSDLTTFVVSDYDHSWPTLTATDMAHIFPQLPQEAFQNLAHPDDDSRYFMVKIKWQMEGMDNVVLDGYNTRKAEVVWYFKESLMPATVTAATGEYWTEGSNMMSDTILGTEDINIAQVINYWTGIATSEEDNGSITNALLAE
jgi:hypothetical protein